jgi:hypothetical protein
MNDRPSVFTQMIEAKAAVHALLTSRAGLVGEVTQLRFSRAARRAALSDREAYTRLLIADRGVIRMAMGIPVVADDEADALAPYQIRFTVEFVRPVDLADAIRAHGRGTFARPCSVAYDFEIRERGAE